MTGETGESGACNDLDLTGLECPMPLLRTKLALRNLSAGETIRVMASDPGSARDIPKFIDMSPHELLSVDESESLYCFVIRKGE